MKYATAWVRDGALRDIYVFESNLGEWQKVLDFVRNAYPFTFRVDDLDMPLPASASTIFQSRSEHTHLLIVEAGENVNIHCHFSLKDEIEFDACPREIESETEEDAVVRFMKGLCEALQREVVLTMEGMPDWVYLSITPGQKEPQYMAHEVEVGRPISRDEALRRMAKQFGLDANDHEGVIQRLKDSGNRPHRAWRKPKP